MITSEIKTIEQLKYNLNMGPGYGGYIDILKAIDLPASEWENHCLWKEDGYSRNCLSNCDAFELLLMCWEEGQHSAIHSYNFQEGWVKVLQGELTIETFNIDEDALSCKKVDSRVVKEDDFTYLNDSMGFHRVTASGKGRTVSLNLHAERVKEWKIFHDCKKEITNYEPQYDSKTEDCTE